MSPTPPEHTLYGVLTRLRAGHDVRDPALAQRLDQAFAKHVRGLSAFVRRELRGSPDEVTEEVVQEVLVEAWRKLPAYRPESPVRKHHDALSADGLVDGHEDATVLGRMLAVERDELVEKAIGNVLSEVDREIAYLRYVEDYGYVQIAEHLGFETPDAARVGLQRVRRRLGPEIRRLLAEHGLGSSFL